MGRRGNDSRGDRGRTGSGAGPFSPVSIAGMTLWIDPSLSLTADQSGAGHNITNAGTATAGTGINGRATTSLDRVAKYLNAGASSLFITAAAWTYFVVWNYSGSVVDGANYYNDAALAGDMDGAAGGFFGISASTTTVRFGQQGGPTNGVSTAITAGTSHYGIFRWNGAILQRSVDGGAFDAGTASTNVQNITHSVYIGRNEVVAGTFTKAELGDYGFYNTAISDTAAATLGAYLKAKYGL